jgi:surfeit locus 1 family protein
MADGQKDTDLNPFVPSGLKVRGAASSKPVVAPRSAPYSDADFPKRRASDKIAAIIDPALEPLPISDPPINPKASKGRRAGFEPMPILTLVTAICLAILALLGSWQWEKFVTKSDAPVEVSAAAPSSVDVALQASNPEFRPVVVEGLMDARTIKISAVQDAVRGYRLFSPVIMEVGSVFVDRGFVSEDDVAKLPSPAGQVRLEGIVRLGAKANAYTPDNEAVRDVWYWPDLKAMADVLLIQPVSNKYYVALKTVDPLVSGRPVINPYADKKGANQIPPERHLGYALTWWGFGLALIGVYIGMHVRAGRLRFKRTFS